MKIYKKIIILLILVIGGTFFVMTHLEEVKFEAKRVLKAAKLMTVCDETLYYSLGDIDPRFGISEERILNVLRGAESIWEKELNRNIFEYKEGAEFKINFVFDERQEQTIEEEKLDVQLEELAAHQGDISKNYQAAEADYNEAVAAYEKKVKTYEEMVNSFNEKISKWNDGGNESENTYNEFKKESDKINELKNQLEKERKNINNLATQMNGLVNKESNVIENYNDKIQTYRERFGEINEFNQGEYIGMAINIYQFHEESDLKLVLAHELGHALKLDHVDNPESTMFHLMEKQNLENIKLTEEDRSAVMNICGIK
ncbi:MAG: matrixin family metalloprotease [Candidatus Moranbacteria bacterium]|jgi:chromosome segregation ATPase|nr:matrixin family metalloprotease [Candidatus Moranbacteria bacterium]